MTKAKTERTAFAKSVTLIARFVYDWVCPRCDKINCSNRWNVPVKCKACGQEFKVREVSDSAL